jgi:hypothetical protein
VRHEQEDVMTAGRHREDPRADRGAPPPVNTHVHLPPNFSAFRTAEDAVAAGAHEGIRVMGGSNFHDLGVYAQFRDAAQAAGIVPLFGIEIISLLEDLRVGGIKINDPANPGRIYLCGKGIAAFDAPGDAARAILKAIRAGDEARMRRMTARLEGCFADVGIAPGLDHDAIVRRVADAAGVPPAWCVLQERHLARAYQEALFAAVAPEDRPDLMARLFGGATSVDVRDAAAVQAEIRARLLRAGRPAFEPETQIAFEDAHRLTLALGAIPCYPTLADGASPICPWEDPAEALAERVLERGIPMAELIPLRNQPGMVDRYVAAYRSAGILVLAGTEHNTPLRSPMEPRCVDGSYPSPSSAAAFWEATCVVAAHQHRTGRGEPGYVDGEGRLAPGFPDGEARIRWFRELGEELIATTLMEGSR